MKCDLWSLGCILYTLLTLKPPFESPNVQETLQKVVNGRLDLPWFLSPEAKDLISKLLTRDPTSRITIDDVLANPFV